LPFKGLMRTLVNLDAPKSRRDDIIAEDHPKLPEPDGVID
jgi:hypothetical protein